jgi:transposase-like protein
MEDPMAGKRKRRALPTRRRWAQRWLDSGLTQREFAGQHGLTVASLSRWARELRDDDDAEAQGEFVEVGAATPVRCAVRVRVGAVTLEFDQLPPAEYVAALGRAAC